MKKIITSVTAIMCFLLMVAHAVNVYLMDEHKKHLTKIEKSIPVLIIDGFSNHDWKQSTTIVK